MPRATGNDLCEIFGYAPDDRTNVARKQWKSQLCPFAGGQCIKHTHPRSGQPVVVLGTCSVTNKTVSGVEDVITCVQRLYADEYEAMRSIVWDAVGYDPPLFLAAEYAGRKRLGDLPDDYVVMLGRNSGREIRLRSQRLYLSLDWVLARIVDDQLYMLIPCEVQSADTTGNYHANWEAYARELDEIPDSQHGMNWANIWKRIIPQLILKGSVAATSKLCTAGQYFVVPDLVYTRFERLLGPTRGGESPEAGTLTVMTYGLGPPVPHGAVRTLRHQRTLRMPITEFARAFASAGRQTALGAQLEAKVLATLESL
jgi:hypothetical protein